MIERYLTLFSRYVKNIFGDTKEVADWDNGGIQVARLSKKTDIHKNFKLARTSQISPFAGTVILALDLNTTLPIAIGGQ